MRELNGKYYPGFLKHEHHTLKQMHANKRRSKGVNLEYWLARIEDHKLEKTKLREFFDQEEKNRMGNTKKQRKEILKQLMDDKL